VYTHGEMLPGHGYPELHKYPHLVGNYGGAWYRQRRDFAEFPGPILMTTNCIVDPPASYAGEWLLVLVHSFPPLCQVWFYTAVL
jgi:hydroxylamine reductase